MERERNLLKREYLSEEKQDRIGIKKKIRMKDNAGGMQVVASAIHAGIPDMTALFFGSEKDMLQTEKFCFFNPVFWIL